jgi:hypothetical protein
MNLTGGGQRNLDFRSMVNGVELVMKYRNVEYQIAVGDHPNEFRWTIWSEDGPYGGVVEGTRQTAMIAVHAEIDKLRNIKTNSEKSAPSAGTNE